MKWLGFLFLYLSIHVTPIHAQSFLDPADGINKPRLIATTAVGAIAWGGSIAALHYVWYADFEKSKFHFFNDSHEWGQMDKMGHLYTAFQFSTFISDLYQWSGVKPKKAALIGAAYSVGYLTTFEILDAYNTEWGFSLSDLGFNLLGTAFSASQTYFWNKRFVNLKFSVHNSGLADYRPNVLGNDFASRTLKDYNGQTYWMSFNPFTWGKRDTKIPAWINLSIGYGIGDQLIGSGGTYVVNTGTEQLNFTPYRQCFLSLDIDFEKIETDSRALKILFRGLNLIKLPFPTLELSQGKVQFHPLYF